MSNTTNATAMTATATIARTYGSQHVSPAAAKSHALAGVLDIVINKRFKKSWRVETDPRTGTRKLTVPPLLADAPDHIKECLVRWALMPIKNKSTRTSEYVKKRRYLENTIRAYMTCHGVPDVRVSRVDPKIYEHQTRGFVFDLQIIFDTLNNVYFGNRIKSYIRWGNPASRISYQDTRIDKSGNTFNLITVSGVYDSPKVPEYAIYGLVYHEMLHIAIPPTRKSADARRTIHGKEFKEAMKRYQYYDEWVKWERENMAKLIAAAKRRVRRTIKNKGAAATHGRR